MVAETLMAGTSFIPAERIERTIYLIRGEKVCWIVIWRSFTELRRRSFNKAVERNLTRFPDDFMFQLSAEEDAGLRFQIGTSKKGRGGRRYLPYGFTEQGVAMLSSFLNSTRAIQVNIEIMRAFVRLRQMLSSNVELSRRLDELESNYDRQFKIVFDAIRQLMTPVPAKRKQIGFQTTRRKTS